MRVRSPRSIVLRAQPVGGEVRASVAAPFGDPSDSTTALIFVHGFNVSHAAACDAYQLIGERLRLDHARIRSQLSHVYWLLWPGDEDAGWVRKVWSYPDQIPKARDAAAKLAAWLSGLRAESGRPEEVVFIAHSLGCRLVLETVKQLRSAALRDTSPRVAGLILMAAAVPQQWCEEQKEFATKASDRDVVLFSKRDLVLRATFPIGQDRAGESPAEAVGLRGRPGGRWYRAKNTKYAHGSYWGGEESAMEAASMLGGTAAHELPEHTLEEPPTEPSAQIASRRLTSADINDPCTLVYRVVY